MAKETKKLDVEKEGGAESTLAVTKENTLAVANEVDDMFGGGIYKVPVDAPLPETKIMREKPIFETPSGDTAKELIGHIIYYHNANLFYETEFGKGEQGPPTCASSDGIDPDGGTNPKSESCRVCSLNEYGSAIGEGKGKACQNTIRLYVLVDGDIMPCLIKATPSSLGRKESLKKWLTDAMSITNKAGMRRAYQAIKIKFTLHTKDFDSGNSASILDLETISVLTPQDTSEFFVLNANGKVTQTKVKDVCTIVRVVDPDYLQTLSQMFKEFEANYKSRIQEYISTEDSQPADDTDDTDGPAPDVLADTDDNVLI